MTRKSSFLFVALGLTILNVAPLLAAETGAQHAMDKTEASYPAEGRRADVDFGEMAFRLDFKDNHRMSFIGTTGASKGVTDTVDYTAREIRPGLYMVYWHEPKTGNNVVHVQDFTNGTVHTNIAQPDGQFLHLNGTLRLSPGRGSDEQ